VHAQRGIYASPTARKYSAKAKADEKEKQKATAWELWLDCLTQQAIADEIGVSQPTVNGWLSEMESVPELIEPPDSRRTLGGQGIYASPTASATCRTVLACHRAPPSSWRSKRSGDTANYSVRLWGREARYRV
jgi:hypothetical protein